MNYFKTLLAFILQIHRVRWLPVNDFGREKRLGMLAIGALVVLFGAVLVYRMQKSPAETGPAPGKPGGVAIAGDSGAHPTAGATRFGEPPKTFGTSNPSTASFSNTTAGDDRYANWNTTSGTSSTSPPGQFAPATKSPAGTIPANATTVGGGTSVASDHRHSLPSDNRYPPRYAEDSSAGPRYGDTVSTSPSIANPLRTNPGLTTTATSNSTAPSPTLSGGVTPASDLASSPTRNDSRVTPASGTSIVSPSHGGNPTQPPSATLSGAPFATSTSSASLPTASTTPTPPSVNSFGNTAAPTTPSGTTAFPPSNNSGVDRYGRPLVATPSTSTSIGALNTSGNPPTPTPSTVTTRDGRTVKVRPYKVREGDTLFDIARYELGKASRWAEIHQLNQQRLGDRLDYLAPGMELLLPENAPVTSPQDVERQPLTTSRELPTVR